MLDDSSLYSTSSMLKEISGNTNPNFLNDEATADNF